jgi:hypothetical protein
MRHVDVTELAGSHRFTGGYTENLARLRALAAILEVIVRFTEDGPRQGKGNTDSSKYGADDANGNTSGSKQCPKIGHEMHKYHCGAAERRGIF